MCLTKVTVNLSTVFVVKEEIVTFSNLVLELTKFGLTKNQALIYLHLVDHKELRIQEIANLTGVPRSSIYESLKGLLEFGIAEEVIDANHKKIRAYPLSAIKHGLDEKLLHLQKLSRDLEVLEKSLSLKNPTTAEITKLRYYKGRSGARQLYWNTLKTNETVYVYSDWGRGRYVGKKFYETFVAESRIKKIKENVLINLTPETKLSIKTFTYPGSPISRTRLEDIRVLDSKKVLIKGDSIIYGNVYAQVYLKNIEISGFEIESQQFAETQRAIFKTLWDTATPVTAYLD